MKFREQLPHTKLYSVNGKIDLSYEMTNDNILAIGPLTFFFKPQPLKQSFLLVRYDIHQKKQTENDDSV